MVKGKVKRRAKRQAACKRDCAEDGPPGDIVAEEQPSTVKEDAVTVSHRAKEKSKKRGPGTRLARPFLGTKGKQTRSNSFGSAKSLSTKGGKQRKSSRSKCKKGQFVARR
eukprot:TRINITY_DN7307_c0_g1_i1.p4 TRINITY_DN7307_c0_g1~~TRINITY_DN7307_c0_g1_i1.p4  ORF type:complete len:110 (+),score=15.92 TRINITY_DN7307_c0_g1_i1:88-417(+)